MICSLFSGSQIRIAATVISVSSFVAALVLVTTNEKAAMATFAAGVFLGFLLTAPPFWLAILLVVLIPFHSLIGQLLGGFESSARQLFVFWKELLLGIGILRVLRHNSRRKEIIASNRWVFIWSGTLILVYCVAFFRSPSIPGIFSLNLETRFLGVMLFFMFLDLDLKRVATLLSVMVWSAGLIALYGLVQYAWDYERLLPLVYYPPTLFVDGNRRLYSFSLNPFEPAYGALIAILILFSGAGRSRLRAVLPWFALLLPCLLLTYTRSAYIGLLAGVATICVVGHHYVRRHAVILYVAVCVVCVTLLFGGASVYKSRIGQRLQTILTLTDDSSIAHKESIEKATRVIFTSPFGIGLGTYGTIQARFVGGVSEAEFAENWVLQVAVQTGLIGAIVYLALTGAILVMLLRRRPCLSKDWSLLRACAGGVFVATTIAGVMIPVWDALIPAVYVWALVGIALANGSLPNPRSAPPSGAHGALGEVKSTIF